MRDEIWSEACQSPGPGLHVCRVRAVVWFSEPKAAHNFSWGQPGEILLSLRLASCTAVLTISLYLGLNIYRSRRWDTSPGWTAQTWPTCSQSPLARPPWRWARRTRRTPPDSRSPGWLGPTPPAPPSHSWCRGGRPRSCWPAWPGAWVCPDSTGGTHHGPSPPPQSADTPGSERRGSWTPPSQHQLGLGRPWLTVRRRRRGMWCSWRVRGPEPSRTSTSAHCLPSRNKVTSIINKSISVVIQYWYPTHLCRISFTKLLKSSLWGFRNKAVFCMARLKNRDVAGESLSGSNNSFLLWSERPGQSTVQIWGQGQCQERVKAVLYFSHKRRHSRHREYCCSLNLF